jgi:hypothetical protein
MLGSYLPASQLGLVKLSSIPEYQFHTFMVRFFVREEERKLISKADGEIDHEHCSKLKT